MGKTPTISLNTELIYSVLALISAALISYFFYFDWSVFVFVLAGLLAISAISSLIAKRRFDSGTIERYFYSISYAALLSTLLYGVVIYVLSSATFYTNLFLLVSVVVLIVFWVFLTLAVFFSKWLDKHSFNKKDKHAFNQKIIIKNLAVSVVVVLIVNAIVLITIAYMISQNQDAAFEDMKSQIKGFKYSPLTEYGDYAVFHDIKAYEDQQMRAINQKFDSIERSMNQNIYVTTLTNEIFKTIADAVVVNVKVIKESYIFPLYYQYALNESKKLDPDTLSDTYISNLKLQAAEKISELKNREPIVSEPTGSGGDFFISGLINYQPTTYREMIRDGYAVIVARSYPTKYLKEALVDLAYIGDESDFFIYLYDSRKEDEDPVSKVLRYKLIIEKAR